MESTIDFRGGANRANNDYLGGSTRNNKTPDQDIVAAANSCSSGNIDCSGRFFQKEKLECRRAVKVCTEELDGTENTAAELFYVWWVGGPSRNTAIYPVNCTRRCFEC